MRILQLTTHLNSGGITSYLLTLCKGLRSRGHEVFIVSAGGNRQEEFEQMGVKCFNLDFRVHSFLHPKVWVSFLKLLKIVDKNNIQICHTHMRVAQVMGAALRLFGRCRHVSTCHGFFKVKLLRRIFPCWGERVVAISSAVRDHLIEDFRVCENRIVFIQTGIDLSRFVNVDFVLREKVREKFHFTNETVIGMVARFSDVKGQDILIRAYADLIKKVSPIKLWLIGEGRFQNVIDDLIEEFGLKDDVILTGQSNDLPAMLQAMDIVVVPSRKEGLGLSVMEAQASGRCVVASRVGGIVSLIEDHKTGLLVESENVEALTEALLDVIVNSSLAEGIGAEAKRKAIKEYSADLMVEDILNMYRGL